MLSPELLSPDLFPCRLTDEEEREKLRDIQAVIEAIDTIVLRAQAVAEQAQGLVRILENDATPQKEKVAAALQSDYFRAELTTLGKNAEYFDTLASVLLRKNKPLGKA